MADLIPPIRHAACALIWFLSVTMVSSCSDDPGDDETAAFNKTSRQCLQCHDVTLDNAHLVDCDQCHQPAEFQDGFPEDHPSVIAMPAHPDVADRTCGQCHDEQTAMVRENNHYRLTGHIETMQAAFGVNADPQKTEETTPHPVFARQNPETKSGLAEDLLSRRCLRCHVYSSGDTFSAVSRGTGCASCHLAFSESKLSSHQFVAKPSDDRCLSCHYGNHVGFDFYGRYEHDLNEEYRTPYFMIDEESPPYGVEYHQLTVDVHHKSGMVCVDCHTQADVMGNSALPSCKQCHSYQQDQPTALSIAIENQNVTFISAATSKSYTIPQMTHQAHDRFGNRFSCQACHAQWVFNDGPTHLLRIDHEEFDNFYKLSIDGSYEVHQIVSSHITDDGDLLEPFMTDKFTGEPFPGIWFRGFVERRWERMLLMENSEGRITTARPILDLYLSWIDEDEQIRFENIRPVIPGLRPYAPHSIGKAGLFYQERIAPFIEP